MKGIVGIAIVVVALLTMGLGWGQGASQTYRYKLSLELNTPTGVKSGASVVEVKFYHGTQVRGEALYLDLGRGQRPLVALLTKDYMRPESSGWSYEHPTKLLGRVYGEQLQPGDTSGDAWRERIFQHRGAKEITPADLPDLVTFADVNDPKTVMPVDPEHLEQALGPGVSWKRIAIEVSDQPITTGIKNKLPWMDALEAGSKHGDLNLNAVTTVRIYPNSFANTLTWTNFKRVSF